MSWSRLHTAASRSARLVRRFGRNRRGAAVVEFALGAVALIVVSLGAIDFSMAMWTTNTLKQVATAGGRFAAIRGAEKPYPASESDVVAYVRDQAAGLNPNKLLIDVSWSPNNTQGSRVTVTVGYDFNFVAMGFLPLAPIRIEKSATMTVG